jgi:DICT domain-containing protein
LNILNNFISLFSICQKTHQELPHIKYNEHHVAGVWTKSTGVSHVLAASHVLRYISTEFDRKGKQNPTSQKSQFIYDDAYITYLKLLRNYTILINIAKVMCSCHLTSKAIDYCGFSISCQFFQPSIDFGNSGVHRVVTNLQLIHLSQTPSGVKKPNLILFPPRNNS